MSASPSGSVSAPAPVVRTLPPVEAFSVMAALSLFATGAGFVTFQVNVCEVCAPDGSVAVIVTVYGPPTEALGSMVPVMRPVFGSMLSPGGNVPPSLKTRTSLPSGSLKFPETLRLTLPLSLLFCVAMPVEVGASFVPVTVYVTVAVSVPPSPSLTV